MEGERCVHAGFEGVGVGATGDDIGVGGVFLRGAGDSAFFEGATDGNVDVGADLPRDAWAK